MYGQFKVSLYIVMSQNVILERETSQCLMKSLGEDFKRSLTYPSPKSFVENRAALRKKHSEEEQAIHTVWALR